MRNINDDALVTGAREEAKAAAKANQRQVPLPFDPASAPQEA